MWFMCHNCYENSLNSKGLVSNLWVSSPVLEQLVHREEKNLVMSVNASLIAFLCSTATPTNTGKTECFNTSVSSVQIWLRCSATHIIRQTGCGQRPGSLLRTSLSVINLYLEHTEFTYNYTYVVSVMGLIGFWCYKHLPMQIDYFYQFLKIFLNTGRLKEFN